MKEDTFTVYLTEKEIQQIEYQINLVIHKVQYEEVQEVLESILKKLKNA